MVDYPDILNYSREELIEEFCKLFDRYQELQESSEADTQKIHELKRSLDTAIAAQAYLSQELEQYTNGDGNSEENELVRTQADLVELKKKYGKLEMSFSALQQDYSTLMEENATISQNLEEALKRNENIPVVLESKTSDEDLLRIEILEKENMDLLEKVEDFEERVVQYTLTIAECEKKMEIFQDQITCLEENLQSKRTDLEEKVQILESTQEQLCEANAKIAMLSAAPENNDRKGNSLFAEVDDQRQAMKQLLAAQKKSYLQMKKIYNESEHEIRRLKRENVAMHTELEACSSIFCNADKVYKEKLNDRVHHLLDQNEELSRKLDWTQERLKELASQKGAVWLDTMLSLCKNETADLKTQLNRVRMQKSTLEEQLRNAEQDMARWRFESLKSRCVLIDREQLLTENKIAFKPVHAIEFRISEKDKSEARPRIVSKRKSSTFDSVVARRSMTPMKEVTSESETISQVTEEKQIKLTEKQNESAIAIETSAAPNAIIEKNSNDQKSENSQENVIEIDIKENSIACEKSDKVENVKEIPIITIDLDKNTTTEETEVEDDKENNNSSMNSPLSDNFAKLKAKPPSPMRPSQRPTKNSASNYVAPGSRSILTKQRDLITKEPCKNVKFSSKADTVHNLSPNTPQSSSKAFTPNKDGKPTSNDKPVNSKNIVKSGRSKSNVVVRRVAVSASKHD